MNIQTIDRLFEDEIIFEMEDETMHLFDDGYMIDYMANLPIDDADCMQLADDDLEGEIENVL